MHGNTYPSLSPSLREEQGRPWGLGGKESTCQGRSHGLDPWSGRTPHTAEQLRPCAPAPESALQSPRATATDVRTPRNKRSPTMRSPLSAA